MLLQAEHAAQRHHNSILQEDLINGEQREEEAIQRQASEMENLLREREALQLALQDSRATAKEAESRCESLEARAQRMQEHTLAIQSYLHAKWGRLQAQCLSPVRSRVVAQALTPAAGRLANADGQSKRLIQLKKQWRRQQAMLAILEAWVLHPPFRPPNLRHRSALRAFLPQANLPEGLDSEGNNRPDSGAPTLATARTGSTDDLRRPDELGASLRHIDALVSLWEEPDELDLDLEGSRASWSGSHEGLQTEPMANTNGTLNHPTTASVVVQAAKHDPAALQRLIIQAAACLLEQRGDTGARLAFQPGLEHADAQTLQEQWQLCVQVLGATWRGGDPPLGGLGTGSSPEGSPPDLPDGSDSRRGSEAAAFDVSLQTLEQQLTSVQADLASLSARSSETSAATTLAALQAAWHSLEALYRALRKQATGLQVRSAGLPGSLPVRRLAFGCAPSPHPLIAAYCPVLQRTARRRKLQAAARRNYKESIKASSEHIATKLSSLNASLAEVLRSHLPRRGPGIV
jgi:hypothetical protein